MNLRNRRRIPRGQLYHDGPSVRRRALQFLPRHLYRGPRTAEFERAFAQMAGASHAIALPRARVALHTLLAALALPRGSEVAMTPLTIPDIVNVIIGAGLVPRFVDLGPRTANMCPEDLARRVGPRTRALLLTHLCGFASDMTRLLEVARAHDLLVLEDCSQVMGATYRGQPLGTFGRAAFFSLTTLKPLSTFHGGMTITDDAELAAALQARAEAMPPPPRDRFLQMLARDELLHLSTSSPVFDLLTFPFLAASERWQPELAWQFQRGNLFFQRSKWENVFRRDELPADMFVRYTDYQASVGLDTLPRLAAGNARRRHLAELLLAHLRAANVPGLPELLPDTAATWWRFPLWTDDPGALRAHLRRHGIDSTHTNLPCLSDEPLFGDLRAHLPEAEAYARKMVFLPMHPSLDEDDVARMAAATIGYYQRRGTGPARADDRRFLPRDRAAC